MIPARPEEVVGDALHVEVVDEGDLNDADHRAVCDLLATVITREKALYRERGWRTLRPEFRVLVRAGEGRIVGHGSCFRLSTTPPLDACGIGDVVVHPEFRRRGIGALVARKLSQEGPERGAELRLAETVALGNLAGGRRVRPFEVFYEREGACHYRPNWWIWERHPEPGRRIRLAEGDF